MKKITSFLLMLIALPCQAWAHEGHGTPGQGDTVSHYVLEPLHLPLAVVTIVFVIWFTYRLQKWLSGEPSLPTDR